MPVLRKQILIHGTAVSIQGYGVLILGPSGSGKSDIALRLMDRGAILISDDSVFLDPDPAAPTLHAPTTIIGKIEVRGVGICDVPNQPQAPLSLCILLDGEPIRYPDPWPMHEMGGIDIPALTLRAFEVSTPIKIEYAIQKIISNAEKSQYHAQQ